MVQNLNSTITITYKELIDAFEEWVTNINSVDSIKVPEGETLGIMCTNHIITIINSNRQKFLSTYK